MPIGSQVSAAASLNVSFRDIAGEVARIVFEVGTPPSSTQLATFVAALANVSNARVERIHVAGVTRYASVPLFDEAYASASVKLIMVFQTDTGLTRLISVPAPDASLFLPDGVTVDTENPNVAALVSAYRSIVGSDFTLRRGILSIRSRRIFARQLAPGVAEPESGQLPPPGPGLPPE